MKSGLDTYKGKTLFIARYDHMTLDELKKEVEEVKAYMAQNMANSDMFVLVDTNGTLVSPEVLNLFKEISSKSSEYKTKTAILGMAGPRRVFLDIVSKFSKVSVMPFDDPEKARDWLVA
jgi:hypothetical protein